MGVSASDIGQTGSWCVKRQRERRTGVSASDIGQTGSWCVKRHRTKEETCKERNMAQ